MTGLHRVERLGVCVHVDYGDHAALRVAMAQVAELGLRHVQWPLSARDIADPDWMDAVVTGLGADATVLADAADGLSDEALARLAARRESGMRGVEWRDDPACTPDAAAKSLAATVDRAGRHGVHVVASFASDAAQKRLLLLAGLGALRGVRALGLRLGPDEDPQDVRHVVSRVADARDGIDTAVELWVFAAAGTGRPHDIAGHAAAMLDMLASDADRFYWPALSDTSSRSHVPTTPAFYDAAGQPRLLGRLLAGGIGDVERVVALARRETSLPVAATRPVLVTGGAGFIGANLADRLASEGRHVLIYDALARAGVERNLRWLMRRHPTKISFALADLRDETALSDAASTASAIFHLAGQVAVTTSMMQPLEDFEVNARGTLGLLDAVRRHNADCPLIFASTNKVYGDLADIVLTLDGDRYLPVRADLRARGVAEDRTLCFHTPYGCSKGAADQYVLDYAHSFGLRTAVLRMSCIYGERQLGTEDQGWVAHFLLRAIAGAPITIYGDGRQVRDVLHVGDAVDAYLAALRDIDKVAGRPYNLGGGPANAISLLQLVEEIEQLLGKQLDVTFSSWRPGDQRYFVADTGAIRRDLALPPALGWRAGLARLAEHFGARGTHAMTMTEAAV